MHVDQWDKRIKLLAPHPLLAPRYEKLPWHLTACRSEIIIDMQQTRSIACNSTKIAVCGRLLPTVYIAAPPPNQAHCEWKASPTSCDHQSQPVETPRGEEPGDCNARVFADTCRAAF